MIPLTRPTLPKLKNIYPKIKDVFESGMITEAKYVREFEALCAKKLGVKNIVAVSNGTSALLLVLKCLLERGEVILPSFTYTSDGHAILWCGLKPVFVDINPETFNVDPYSIEKKITKNTKAILPTHVFGNPCDIGTIQAIAKKHNIKVIYDGAHAFGSTYKGKPLAVYGDATIYSLTPTKVLTAFEGGLIATNNDSLAKKLRLAKNNGDSFNRDEEFLGITARMNEFSAVVGIEGLKIFDGSIKRREKMVDIYKKKLSKIPGISFQKILPKTFSIFKDFVVMVDEKEFGTSRDNLLKILRDNNIQSKVYFEPPLHKKKVYLKYKDLYLPNTDFISKNILDLPLYSHMPIKEVNEVCSVIKKVKNNKNKYQ